jgi:hypothetical protein
MLLKTVPAISIILCEHIENWYENSIFFIYAAVVPWMENLSIFISVDPLPLKSRRTVPLIRASGYLRTHVLSVEDLVQPVVLAVLQRATGELINGSRLNVQTVLQYCTSSLLFHSI